MFLLIVMNWLSETIILDNLFGIIWILKCCGSQAIWKLGLHGFFTLQLFLSGIKGRILIVIAWEIELSFNGSEGLIIYLRSQLLITLLSTHLLFIKVVIPSEFLESWRVTITTDVIHLWRFTFSDLLLLDNWYRISLLNLEWRLLIHASLGRLFHDHHIWTSNFLLWLIFIGLTVGNIVFNPRTIWNDWLLDSRHNFLLLAHWSFLNVADIAIKFFRMSPSNPVLFLINENYLVFVTLNILSFILRRLIFSGNILISLDKPVILFKSQLFLFHLFSLFRKFTQRSWMRLWFIVIRLTVIDILRFGIIPTLDNFRRL